MRKITFFVLLVSLFFPISLAHAEQTSSSVSSDADVKSQFPTTNFGSGSHNYTFRTTSGNKARLFLKFPLPSIPSGSTINQAYVTVKSYTDECFGTPNANYVSAPTSDWGENSITWNNQPAASGMVSVYFPCQTNTWIAFSVVDIVREMYAGTRQNFGFLIWGEEGVGNWQRTIYTREFGYSGGVEYLYVDYTPPAAAPAGTTQPSGSSASSGTTTTPAASGGVTTPSKPTAPATTTSNILKPATSLALSPVEGTDQTLVKLSWTASTTTGIDGYKVFRSENENSDFLSIATTDKNTPTFTDSVDSSKNYFYKVRAYKGSDESADSNIVKFEAKTKVDTSDTTVKKLSLKDRAINFLKTMAAKIVLIVLVLIALAALIAIWWKRRSLKTPAKK